MLRNKVRLDSRFRHAASVFGMWFSEHVPDESTVLAAYGGARSW